MSTNAGPSIYECVARYEREITPESMPALGEVTMIGQLQTLMMLRGKRPTLWDFIPMTATPQHMQADYRAIKSLSEEFGFPRDDAPADAGGTKWYDPRQGLKAVDDLLPILKKHLAGNDIPCDVREMLIAELGRLKSGFETAVQREIGFYIELRVCENPPEAVRNWCLAFWKDIGECLKGAL